MVGPRANNYGVISNTPNDSPSRRVDRIGLDTITKKVYDNKGAKVGEVAFCRCYRSTTFPWCDGVSHHKHCSQTGDNIGPIIIQKANKKSCL